MRMSANQKHENPNVTTLAKSVISGLNALVNGITNISCNRTHEPMMSQVILRFESGCTTIQSKRLLSSEDMLGGTANPLEMSDKVEAK